LALCPDRDVEAPAVYWGFVIFLAAIQVYANFGPPPASEIAMGVMALAFYAVLATLAAAVERYAVTTATPRAVSAS